MSERRRDDQSSHLASAKLIFPNSDVVLLGNGRLSRHYQPRQNRCNVHVQEMCKLPEQAMKRIHRCRCCLEKEANIIPALQNEILERSNGVSGFWAGTPEEAHLNHPDPDMMFGEVAAATGLAICFQKSSSLAQLPARLF